MSGYLPPYLLGLTDEVPDLGRNPFAFGRTHACRVLGDFLGGAFHLLAQLVGARLGPGIETGDAGHLGPIPPSCAPARTP